MAYYQVLISAEERVQGMAILRALIAKRLAFGGPVFNGGALFLWENEVVENDYCYAITYTTPVKRRKAGVGKGGQRAGRRMKVNTDRSERQSEPKTELLIIYCVGSR